MRPRVGIIGGSGLSRSGLLEDVEELQVETPYGPPSGPLEVGRAGDTPVAFLPRHGPDRAVPPHRVNHRANLWALKEREVEEVVGTSSVGSLTRALAPGSFVVPDDYFSPWQVVTFHDEAVVHVTPGLDEGVRSRLIEAGRAADVVLHETGVYVQTRGPRLETRAEIRFLQEVGTVVGMTMASEATLAREASVPYASLCSVDNYAHGLQDEPLAYADIRRVQEKNATAARRILRRFLEGAR